jgi:hypothetical protein
LGNTVGNAEINTINTHLGARELCFPVREQSTRKS